MGIIGSNWKDEPSNEDLYNEITNECYQGRSKYELVKDIESRLDDNFISRTERERLLDLYFIMIDENNK